MLKTWHFCISHKIRLNHISAFIRWLSQYHKPQKIVWLAMCSIRLGEFQLRPDFRTITHVIFRNSHKFRTQLVRVVLKSLTLNCESFTSMPWKCTQVAAFLSNNRFTSQKYFQPDSFCSRTNPEVPSSKKLELENRQKRKILAKNRYLPENKRIFGYTSAMNSNKMMHLIFRSILYDAKNCQMTKKYVRRKNKIKYCLFCMQQTRFHANSSCDFFFIHREMILNAENER